MKRHVNFSIIVPVLSNSFSYIKECIDSILRYTDFSNLDTELLVLINENINEEIIDYLKELSINYNSFFTFKQESDIDNNISKLLNIGVKETSGKYIVILRENIKLEKQYLNKWINLLYRPFITNSKLGITSTSIHYFKSSIKSLNIIPTLKLHCSMIKRSVFEKVGVFNEDIVPGYGDEDIEFSLRTKLSGFELKNTSILETNNNVDYYSFPISHQKNIKTTSDIILSNSHNLHIIENHCLNLSKIHNINDEKNLSINDIIITSLEINEVTVCISTKDRYFTTLPLTIQSVLNQTVKPRKIIIFDDSDNVIDLYKTSPYNGLFGLLKNRDIEFEIINGEKRGQIFNHQNCLEIAKTEYIWRLDDDNVPDLNVLENYLKIMNNDKKIGAVGSLVLDPDNIDRILPSFLSNNKIEEIFFGLNIQWFKHYDNNIKEVDHLYSTFLYRKQAGFPIGYCLKLGKIGFREETIFTYKMKRNGWKLFVDPNVITWHMKTDKGGLRDIDISDNTIQKNEAYFYQLLTYDWGIEPIFLKVFPLQNGIGDHFIFKMLLPKIFNKFSLKNHKIVLAPIYPKVFSDIENINICTIKEVVDAYGESYLKNKSIYEWCLKNKWKKSLLEAMEILYVGD